MALQNDGKIVAAGYTAEPTDMGTKPWDFAVVRYPVAATSSAPRLLSLMLTTSTIPGGASQQATIELCEPAPPGGATVRLSDTLEAASAPASVTIPAGARIKTFTVKTAPVTANERGTMTATLGLITKSASLMVQPIVITDLTVDINPVTGPGSVTGVVQLNGPAPSGGFTVTLSSSKPAAARLLVNTITIPKGKTFKSFTIRAEDVPSPTSAIIRAVANNVSKSLTLYVH